MSGTKHFDDLTHWDQQTARWSWRGGLAAYRQAFRYLTPDDPYWGACAGQGARSLR